MLRIFYSSETFLRSSKHIQKVNNPLTAFYMRGMSLFTNGDRVIPYVWSAMLRAVWPPTGEIVYPYLKKSKTK